MYLLISTCFPFLLKMGDWGMWEFSPEAEEILSKICNKLDPEGVSKDWLDLLNYGESHTCPMQTDVTTKEEILNIVNECIKSETVLSEQTFVGVSGNSLNNILMSLGSALDEFGFCSFCKFIASWSNDNLIEQSLKLVLLPKLKENSEASVCVTFSIKELAIKKPDKLCQCVLIPLLTDCKHQFTDVELLTEMFTTLPMAEKDLIIRKLITKEEFVENDWLLLHLIIKDLSQNSLLCLLECAQKFSHKFTKSQGFGRFLVNFCKNFGFFGSKYLLREVVENHETLLKTQAMKYLELE